MNYNILIPLFIGCVSILQGTINRQIAGIVGVTQTALIGNLATVVVCVAFYMLTKKFPEMLPEIFHLKAPITTYKWWFFIPAIFGFIIVAGMPFAISRLGAVKVTVGLIAAQMITSVCWDYFVSGISLNLLRFIGIIFSFISVALITLAK